jgi:Amidases related to nicotinamidase
MTSSTSRIAKGGTTLLIIDPQRDFHEGGSLAVPNASADAKRIASFIRSSITRTKPTGPFQSKIDRIVVTLDSHHKLHIAHPQFWKSKDGNHPTPFTIISSADIKNGKWQPREDLKLPVDQQLVDPNILKVKNGFLDKQNNFDLKQYCIEYTTRLEKSKKFSLCIWPEHCLIGSPGHCVVEEIMTALNEWCASTGKSIEFVMKGQNLLTEMYSAVKAEVEVSPDTVLNRKLLDTLRSADRILVCGQALSHCVNYTARDLIDNMPGEEHKIEVLKNCSSSVSSFEKDGEEFLKYILKKGGKFMKIAQN